MIHCFQCKFVTIASENIYQIRKRIWNKYRADEQNMHYIPLHQLMSTKDRTRLRRNLYVNKVINDIKEGAVEDDPLYPIVWSKLNHTS